MDQNWLADRKQRVTLNGKVSGWGKRVGSRFMLGPLVKIIAESYLKFVRNDSRICNKVCNEADTEIIRLKKLFQSEDWQVI